MMRHHTAHRKRRAVGSQRPEVRGQKSAAAVGSRHVALDTTRRRVRRHGLAGIVLLACVLSGLATAGAAKPGPKGEVNMEFRDTDLPTVLRALCQGAGLDFVLDPAVKGKVTAKLQNTSWQAALDIVLESHGL